MVLFGYKTVKEALVNQAENFVDRPPNAIAERFYPEPEGVKSLSVSSHILYVWFTYLTFIYVCLYPAGVFMSNGEKWKRQRRFALSTFRTFGLGKSMLEQSICEEIRYLQEELEREKGE